VKSTPPISRASYAIAIGSSAGGISALSAVLRQLLPDLNATVFIVQHLSPDCSSVLSRILQRASALPCAEAAHGELFESGHVYVSPPNRHLEVDSSRMYLSGAATVCHVRPSVDVLFHSVASAFRHRGVGIILTGHLNDGADGLRAIALAGGVTIVQDPEEAHAPGMPQSAINAVQVDHRLLLHQIGPYLQRSIGSQVPGVREDRRQAGPPAYLSGVRRHALL
jgi:two-component system, chemotaxis family, protein-glutamate methylesterase/glutaminase